jgi:uncharacterized LabA/DUF88 family protein
MRTTVYVDGFNVYYGCARRYGCKWLDLNSLCEKLLPNDTIATIRYFTARVKSRPDDPQQPQRQQVYLRALQTLPNIEIHYGSFLVTKRFRRLVVPLSDGQQSVEVWNTEEKGSDVNLAAYLLLDAFRNRYDQAVILSNDTDLVEPIRLVRTELGLPVGVFNPHPHPSLELRQVATFYRPIRQGPARDSQFPPIMHDADGTIAKPAGW